MTPKNALEACRDAGLTEGEQITDVRAGPCRITTLEADTVILTAGSDQRLDAGDATDLWESYQDGSIRLDEDAP